MNTDDPYLCRCHWGRLAWLLLLASMLAGCQSPEVVHRSLGFDARSLKAGGLSIVAITSAETPEYLAGPYIAERVQAQLQERWPELAVVPLAEARAMIGKEPYEALCQTLRQEGELKRDGFEWLKPLAGVARYALFVDVQADKVENNTFFSSKYDSEPVTDPQTGEVDLKPTTTTYQTTVHSTRSLLTVYTFYDLAHSQPVWIVRHKASRTLGSSGYSDWYYPDVGTPVPPTPSDMMARATKVMLRKLPE